jgi:hypothetical protein
VHYFECYKGWRWDLVLQHVSYQMNIPGLNEKIGSGSRKENGTKIVSIVVMAKKNKD